MIKRQVSIMLLQNDGQPEIYIYIYIQYIKILAKFRAVERTRKLALLAIICSTQSGN